MSSPVPAGGDPEPDPHLDLDLLTRARIRLHRRDFEGSLELFRFAEASLFESGVADSSDDRHTLLDVRWWMLVLAARLADTKLFDRVIEELLNGVEFGVVDGRPVTVWETDRVRRNTATIMKTATARGRANIALAQIWHAEGR